VEVAVFAEDISKRLLDNVICRCMDEGGILIDPHRYKSPMAHRHPLTTAIQSRSAVNLRSFWVGIQ
jgi:hypothetical protein